MNWIELNESPDGPNYHGYLTIAHLNCIIMARIQAGFCGFSTDITVNNKTMTSESGFLNDDAAKKWCEHEVFVILNLATREIPQIMEDLERGFST